MSADKQPTTARQGPWTRIRPLQRSELVPYTHAGAPRLQRVRRNITAPYAGLTLRPGGDFVSLQFSRRWE